LAGKTPGKMVAVMVSDSLWPVIRQCCVGDTLNVDALVESLKQWTPYDHFSRQGWDVWRPKEIEITERRQADRKTLARFIRDFTSEGTAGLRMIANLYRDASEVPSQFAETWLVDAQLSTGKELLASLTLGPEFYRVIGAIGDSAWSKLVSGQTMSLREVGISDEFTKYVAGMWPPQVVQTDVAMSGLADARLSIQFAKTPLIRRWRADSNHEVGDGMTIDQFVAFFRVPADAFTWNGDQVTATMTQNKFEGALGGLAFRYCTQDRASIRIQPTSGPEITGQFLGNVVPTSGAMTYSELPQDLRDSVWKHAYQAGLDLASRQRAKSAGQSSPPGAGQPPPSFFQSWLMAFHS